jgi:probable HAF family extracellular repeat protein
VDIGPGTALGLNSQGQIGGAFFFSGSASHAFLWDADNGLQDLGTLKGIGQSGAAAINAPGQVVGISSTDDLVPAHAFLWDAKNGMQDLGTLGGDISNARGINDSGQIAGLADLPSQVNHAVLWDADGIHDLGTLGGVASQANALNNAGQVVGSSSLPSGLIHAFLWDSSNGMQDLGTLGGPQSSANGVNEAEQVVGSSIPQGFFQQHAFVWDAINGMQDLGTLPDGTFSLASGISNSGLIVGSSISTATGQRAVLWDANGITDLNDLLPPNSGWTLDAANAVNDAGQIVGFGMFNGDQHAFLLTLDSAPQGRWQPGNHAGSSPLAEVAGALSTNLPSSLHLVVSPDGIEVAPPRQVAEVSATDSSQTTPIKRLSVAHDRQGPMRLDRLRVGAEGLPAVVDGLPSRPLG